MYISSRSQARVDEAIESMKRRAGKELDLRFLQVDLQNLKSVKQAAETFMRLEDRLDVLLNNAGIMSVPYKLTGDGYESQFQVNYLAPFIFTSTLMPLLLSTAAKSERKDRVRVIDLSSEMTSLVGPNVMHLDNVNMFDAKGMTALLYALHRPQYLPCTNHFNHRQRYSHAKQGSIRHAKELNDRYSAQGVTAYSLHPGVVKSNLQGHDPSTFGSFMNLMMKIQPTDSPLHGALTSLYCATMPEAAETGAGRYFTPVAKLGGKEKWLDDNKGNQELWAWSEDVLKTIK